MRPVNWVGVTFGTHNAKMNLRRSTMAQTTLIDQIAHVVPSNGLHL